MRFDFLRSPSRSKVIIGYVFPRGVVLSGLPVHEDPTRGEYSVSIEARQKHLVGLTYLAQIGPGLFSYRLDEDIDLHRSAAKIRVKVFKDGIQVASRSLPA